jgi:hypothetical protein
METSMMLRRTGALTALLSLSLLAACGDNNADNNTANNTAGNNTTANNTTAGNNTTANNTTANNTSANNTSANNTSTPETNPPENYENNYQLRFTRLEFINYPDTARTTFKLLNGLIDMQLDQSLEAPIIVLVDFDNIDPEGGTIGIRAGAGEKAVSEGEYTWDASTSEEYVDGTLDAATGAVEGVIPDFIFVATVETESGNTKTNLPINDLNFTGNLEKGEFDDEVIIRDGNIKGYITKEQGDVTLLSVGTGDPVPVTNLLKEENLNFDSDGDGTNDSWTLEASFDADPTIID